MAREALHATLWSDGHASQGMSADMLAAQTR